MPDSKWSKITGVEARKREQDYNNKGFSALWKRTKIHNPEPQPLRQITDLITGKPIWQIPPDQTFSRTETFTLLFSKGITPPAARSVIQYCDKCDGHTDSLVDGGTLGPIAVPYTKAHVNNGEYGDRKGNLYMQYSIKGTILRRTCAVTRWWGSGTEPPIAPPSAEFDNNIQWERKTVDHVEQWPFIHWISRMKPKDCKHRMRKHALDFREPSFGEMLAADLGESLPREAFSFLDDGSLAKVAAITDKTPDAIFSLVKNEEEKPLELELISAGSDGKPLVHARFTLFEHEGGFFTIAELKSGSSRKKRKK